MKTKNEVLKAYADCNNKYDHKVRNLDFRASEPVSLKDAYDILKVAIPNGYNEFTASKLKILDALLPDAECFIAREGSVCLYITGHNQTKKEIPELMEMLLADEITIEPNKQLRIWWD